MSDEASSRLSAPSAADFAALSKQIYATQGENALQTAEPNYRELVTLIYAFLFVRQGAWQQYFLGPAAQAAFESEGDRVDFSLSALQQSLWTREHQSPDQVVCDTIFDTGDAMFYCRDCGRDEYCVFCSDCFDPDRHPEHDVCFTINQSAPVSCVCSDAEAWRVPIDCPCHGLDRREAPHRLPPELEEWMRKTISAMLDFIIAALAASPSVMLPPSSPQSIPLIFSPDEQSRQQNERVEQGRGPWSVVLWNDEKHSYDQVITQLCRANRNTTRRTALDAANRVDSIGRDVVSTTTDIVHLYTSARIINNIDLACTISSSQSVFYENVAGLLINALHDLAQTSVLSSDGSQRLLRPIRQIIAEELLKKDDEARQTSRFIKLLQADLKLWKRARTQLRSLYGQLIVLGGDIRTALASHFTRMYPNTTNRYLFLDREPEYSIIQLSSQLFGIPSVASRLLSEQAVGSMIIAILYGFFTDQLNRKTKTLVYPPNISNTVANPESPMFKHKRYTYAFADFNRLIGSPEGRKAAVENSSLQDYFASFCAIFHGFNPMTRMLGRHVEYENEAWVGAFNLSMHLAKSTRALGTCFQNSGNDRAFLERTARLFKKLAECTPCRSHYLTFAGVTHQIVDYKVSREAVSFHYPLTWYLAEILKCIDRLDPETMKAACNSDQCLSFRDWVLTGFAGQYPFLTAIEPAVRVNALIAQIRAGLWVRNGLSIRAQQMHYRESGLRDYTLDQEIFMLQAALTIADPSAILITLLDRFEILSWLTDPTYPQEYELSQLFTLTEELLYLLTILLGEPANICCWSPQRVTRREVTQALALGPCSHSELVKRLPETTYDSHRLRQALQDVAHFRHPIGATDHGIYSLKTDVHQELDPFYYRYTRNQRDTCLGTIKECLPPNEQDDYVFLPPPLDITSHSFAQVLSSFESPVLTELLVQCLVRGASSLDQTTEVSDTFLDLTVHLIVLALVNAPQPFASIATRASSYSSSTTLISALHTAHVAATGSLKLRLQWCLRQLGQMPTPRTEQPASSAINSEAEAKKAAAKARQNAIMAQFADAQKAFLENIEDEEEDEGNDTVMGADGLDTATSSGSCIVCQEDLTTSTPYGALALIQASSLVREFDSSVPSTKSPLGLTPGFPSQARAGLHATSCGHLMHVTCFETYCQSIESRHSSNPNRHHPEDLNRREFICPLCKSLGNVMLPHLDAIDMTFIITERADASPLEMFNNSLNALQADINDADRFSGQVAPLLSRGDPQRVRAFSVRNSLPSAVVPTLQPVSSSQMRMIDRVMQVVQPLTMETHWNDSEGLQYYISEELIAYTLACIEIAGRQEGANEQPSYDDEQISKPLAVVKSLLSILPDLAAIGAGSLSGADDTLLAVIAGTLCPLQTSRNATSMASLIRKDPVTMLAESSSLAPQHFSALATFSFYAAIIRSVVALSSMSRQEISALGVGTSESSSPLSADLAEVGHNLASAFDLSFQVESEASSSTRPVLGCAIRRIVLPFLRRSLLLQKCLFESQNIGQSLSFEDMLGQLGIVPPSELQSQQAKALDGWMKEWGQAYMRALRNTSTDPQRVLEHLGPYTLVRLPHRLDQLIGRIKKVPCRRCGKSPADPAVCLLCGELLCAQSFCCMDNTLEEPMHGECNTHMWSCGGSSGIFFFVKKCAILNLYASSGTFGNPPYLDQYGEVDMGHKRHRPQYLNQARFDELRSLWLTQSIPTVVSRKLEASVDLGGWELM